LNAGFLLDVNVLVALAWPAHRSYEKVHKWFSNHGREGWATCSLTQAAFVRILSNPAFSPNALTPTDALVLLRNNLSHVSHKFWADQVGLPELFAAFSASLKGHQQVTDAYLLGLALSKQGKLATMDHSLISLFPDRHRQAKFIELI
jgi:uncharacterized protein